MMKNYVFQISSTPLYEHLIL